METVRTCLTLAAALALTACVSMTYGETGPDSPYGYKDVRQEDGSYILSATHPDPNEAMAFWDRRAEELCGAGRYKKNIYRAIKPTMELYGYGGMAGASYLEGTLTCEGGPAPAASSPAWQSSP